MSLATLSGGSGAAVFNFGGGALQVPANFACGMPMQLTGLGIFLSGGGSLGLLGVLSGNGGLQTVGAGMTVLSASNTYTGSTNISNGTLAIVGSGLLGGGAYPGAIALAANGSLLYYNSSAPQTFSGAISGGGGLTQNGGSMLTLTGNNTYTGPTTVSSGTLLVEGNNASTLFTVNSGSSLQFNAAVVTLGYGSIGAPSGGTVQYSNATINGGFLRGPGTHSTLPGTSNLFTGTTTYASTVLLQNGLDTFTDFSNGGQIVNNAPLVWDGGENNIGGNLTVNSTVTADDFTNAGAISINGGAAINNYLSNMTSGGGGQITINSGGTLNADSQSQGLVLQLQDSLLVNNGTVTGTVNVGYGAAISGSGSFGPVTMSDGGTVVAADDASPAAASLAVVNSGVISGAGTVSCAVTIGTGNLDLVASSSADRLVLTGDIDGPGAVTKLGAGTVVLSGTNTYQGGTTVQDGTLIVANSEAIADGTSLIVGDASLFRAGAARGRIRASGPAEDSHRARAGNVGAADGRRAAGGAVCLQTSDTDA